MTKFELREAKSNLSWRNVLAGMTAAVAATGSAVPAAAANINNRELLRKPALPASGGVVTPYVRSRLFIRRKGQVSHRQRICGCAETPGANGNAFRADIPTGLTSMSARQSDLRGMLGLSPRSSPGSQQW